jgi:shikimate dehydrogenase
VSASPATSGQTATYALVGHPVRRSRSPALHSALFSAAGLDAVYVALDVDPAAAPRVPQAMRTLGLAGANLTVPFKEAVVPQLDALTDAAHAAGSVNTLFWDADRLVGDNTDGAGLLDAAHEAGARSDAPAVVLGAGGTARAVAAALLAAGAPRVTLLNRTLARAEAVAAALRCDAGPLDPGGFVRAGDQAGLVVNCTAGAAAPLVASLSLSALADDAVWIDANYWMPDPPQQRACADRQLRFQTGHAMLLHQGVRAWRRWTGATPSAGAVAAARRAVVRP